jgi:peptide deformylase
MLGLYCLVRMTATRKDIITLPNEHLRQTSHKVGLITPEIRQVVLDMEAATLDWEDSREHEVGVALAGIQIDKKLRIVIIRENIDDKANREFRVFINPEIVKTEGKIEEDFEGCLSIKDVYGKVPRYTKVKVKALDLEGKEFRITAEGFLARVFQHEIDHTKGKVFIDYIKENPEAFYKLKSDGHLEPLDYDTDVKNNSLLW